MKTDEFYLARFLAAQENSYETALCELRAGRKRSHWIWYVFPQHKGLGQSSTSVKFGLTGLSEARAYLAEPVLAGRLREAIQVMLAQPSGAVSVLGELDALKFRSCLTLFSLADPSEFIFSEALARFFDGKRDMRTVELLNSNGEA